MKKMTTMWMAWGLCSVLCLAACGGDEGVQNADMVDASSDMAMMHGDMGAQASKDMEVDTGGGVDLPEEVKTYASYRQALNRAQCEREARCEDGGDVDACVMDSVMELGASRDLIQMSIDTSRVVYDAAQAADCLAAERGSCDVGLIQRLQVCNLVLEGTVAIDGACARHTDCADAEGASPGAPFCYNGCEPLLDGDGTEAGVCVLNSPLNSPECS